MSYKAFNFFLIITTFAMMGCVISIYFFAMEESREKNLSKKQIKIGKIIIIPFIIFALIIFFIISIPSLATKDDKEVVVTIDKIELSYVDENEYIMDIVVYCKNEAGDIIDLYVYDLMPNSFKNHVNSFEPGDVVIVRYTKFLNYIYYIEYA